MKKLQLIIDKNQCMKHFFRRFKQWLFLGGGLAIVQSMAGQSPSFSTYTNPVIPGDHSDCTLTRVGNHYYTTGSSFNPTPVIYHSTDLIHWEAIAQPVSAAWTAYGDAPSGGCWGGQMVYYNNKYWHFFKLGGGMHFVTAAKPEGPWSAPTIMKCPPSVPGLGYDNSIFIDSDSTWYLVAKNGQVNNWIVQLGKDGQPAGNIYDLTWLNPSPSYPYSWAEGPVMWKYKGYYYYSFARDVSGGQKVMRSNTLTADKASWTMFGDLFNENDPDKSKAIFPGPNHSSAAVVIDDSTSWVIHPVWARANNNEWYGQGRQGLVNQVRYDANNRPVVDYPSNKYFTAPKLPSSGIPWMVPKSDFFANGKLNPEWSFLGYTPLASFSLTERPGWLRLKPRTTADSATNTVIKTDAEHNYSLITHLDFNATLKTHEAGIRIMNGMQNLSAKIYSSVDATGQKLICFSFAKTSYKVANTIGNDLWLKLVRVNHILTGYYSINGVTWVQVGNQIDVSTLDSYTANYNGWCGNRQGLYVQGATADFDLYIYRDAYTPILGGCPANQYGTVQNSASSLDSIHNNDWALYAGVEFGNKEYGKIADSVQFVASGLVNGQVEIWLDSIDTGTKIGTCDIKATGSWTVFKTFSAKVSPTTGRHDVYLKFTGSSVNKLFQIKWIQFGAKNAPHFASSSTSSDSTITIKLDKKIKSLGTTPGFLLTLNSSVKDSITQALLNPSDSSEVFLTLLKKVTFFDVIRVSYSAGNVYSPDGMELVAFSNKTVNNLLPDPRPRITNAQTNLSGDSVILQLDKKMQSPGAYKNQFQLFKNSVNSNSISAISLKNNDSSVFILTLNPKVFYEDILTITYSGSSVKSNDGYALQTVSLLPVTNISAGYPPLVTSAVIRKNAASWNTITLKFDRQLADVSTQKKFFSVYINSQLATIDTLKGNSDSIQFTIISAMKYADNIKISYSGGSVASVNNGLLAGFNDYTVSNSIPLPDNITDIKQNETITIYPNPLKNELKVKSKIEFNTLNIYGMDGKSVLEKHYHGNINNTSLELNLNKGIYIIRISNSAASYDTKIIVE
jgi:beta-xylosidase